MGGLRYSDAMYKTFLDMALWNRREPDEDVKIFNIFGHTVTPYGADVIMLIQDAIWHAASTEC